MAELNGVSLEYNGGWVVINSLLFWGINRTIDITFSANKDEDISTTQKETYNWIIENINDISTKSYSVAEEYIKNNADEIISILSKDAISYNLNSLLNLKYFIITEEGRCALCFDAKWDEHGVTIVCKENEMIIGSDDEMWFYL